MAKTRLICENCGFEEELAGKQLKARIGVNGKLPCSACGAALALPEGVKTPKPKKEKAPKKSKYAGPEDMTGLDDVIDGEILESDLEEEKVPLDSEGLDNIEEAPAPLTAEAEEARPEAVEAGPSFEPGAPDFEAGPEQEPGPEAGGEQEPAPEDWGESRGGARALASGAAGAAKEKLRETVRYGRENPLFAAEIINGFFRKIASCADCRFDGIASASMRIGHYSLLIVAALAPVFGIIISIRSLSLDPLLTGVTLSAMLFFAQYLALKGFDLLDGYIEKTPSRLPGAALPEILSAFAVLLALLALLTGLILTINYYSPVWLGTSALGVIGGFFAAAAFIECRSRLNVRFDESLPMSEAVVELTATALKAVVAVVPFMFGLGSAAMALCMIWPTVSMLLFSLNPINTASFFLQEGGLLFCAFSPILAYFFILAAAFILQVARALLGLSGKK